MKLDQKEKKKFQTNEFLKMAALALLIYPLGVMLLWNGCIPDLFNLPSISFPKSMCLYYLSNIFSRTDLMVQGIEYKLIKGYPGFWISENGTVWNEKIKKHLNMTIDDWGIARVIANKKSLPLARLVAMYFIPNPDGKKDVNVKGNPKDCAKDNLQWS